MDPILDKARAAQNALEQIMNAIPGFKGYREQELRRDSDRAQREHLSRRLGEDRKALDQVADKLTRSGSLDPINDVETARKRLDRVANRLLFADRGYSAFFDTVKVDEAMLARVYQFDMSLLQGVEAVGAAGSRAASASDARPALAEMTAALDALDRALSERESILAGVK
jgi:hypothetical protein